MYCCINAVSTLVCSGTIEKDGLFVDETGVEELLSSVLEQLAAAEHERWAHWQSYMHATATRNPDGSLELSAESVAKWERQIATTYSELSDNEKESDREQVRRYLPILRSALKKL